VGASVSLGEGGTLLVEREYGGSGLCSSSST
jgi:hypothetical protein